MPAESVEKALSEPVIRSTKTDSFLQCRRRSAPRYLCKSKWQQSATVPSVCTSLPWWLETTATTAVAEAVGAMEAAAQGVREAALSPRRRRVVDDSVVGPSAPPRHVEVCRNIKIEGFAVLNRLSQMIGIQSVPYWRSYVSVRSDAGGVTYRFDRGQGAERDAKAGDGGTVSDRRFFAALRTTCTTCSAGPTAVPTKSTPQRISCTYNLFSLRSGITCTCSLFLRPENKCTCPDSPRTASTLQYDDGGEATAAMGGYQYEEHVPLKGRDRFLVDGR